MIPQWGKYVLIALLFVAGCSSDFQTKKWAHANLRNKPPQTVIRGVLDVGYVENRGMVFGFMNDKDSSPAKKGLLILRIFIIIGIAVLLYRYRDKPFWFILPFILIISGAVGNVIDIFVYGFVVDFIHMYIGDIFDWPWFFNLADAYLSIGMTLMVLYSLFFKRQTMMQAFESCEL